MKSNYIPMMALLAAGSASSMIIKPSCEVNTSFIMNRCSFSSDVVGEPLLFLGDPISTKFDVTYDTSCEGNPISSLGIGSVSGNSPLHVSDVSVGNEVLSVDSRLPIRLIDNSPTNTLLLSFEPQCQIKIRGVSTYPSISAIQGFVTQAALLTDGLNKDMNLVQLSFAPREMNSLSQEQYQRLRDMAWDYLDFAIEEEFDEGISYFSDAEFVLYYSTEEMTDRGILADWEDFTDDYPSASDLVSVLNFSLQNLDSSTPVTSPLDADLVESSYDSLLQHYERELRRSIRKGRRFMAAINDYVDYMNEEDKKIVESLREQLRKVEVGE